MCRTWDTDCVATVTVDKSKLLTAPDPDQTVAAGSVREVCIIPPYPVVNNCQSLTFFSASVLSCGKDGGIIGFTVAYAIM